MSERWNTWWFGEGSLRRLAVLRILVFLLATDAVAWSNRILLDGARQAANGVDMHWNPVLFVDLLFGQPPSVAVAEGIATVAIVSGLLAAFGLLTRLSCLVASVSLVLAYGLAYSFGQAHHEKIALAFALLAFPLAPCGRMFSLDALLLRRRLDEDATAPWARLPERVAMVAIATGYAFAGGTKMAQAGLSWMEGETLQGIMMSDQGPLSRLVAGLGPILQPLSTLTVLAQIVFPLALFFRFVRPPLLLAVVSFHLVAAVTMNTGWYQTLWMLALVAFLPVENMPRTVRRSLGGHGPRWHAAVLLPPLGLLACWLWFHLKHLPQLYTWISLAGLALTLPIWLPLRVHDRQRRA